METFADRLRALIGEGSRNAFARMCGVGETSLRQYLDGGTPGLDKVVQIAKATNVSLNWLATGEGARDSQVETSHAPTRTEQERSTAVRHLDPKELSADQMVLVPVLDVRASAGTGIVVHSEETTAFVAFSSAYLREIGVNPRFADILQISGRSMLPTLADKDWVVVDHSIDSIIDEALYAVVYGGMVLVKRVRLSRDGSVTLSSDNKVEGYEDEIIRPSELDTLQIVGRVKAHFRPL